MGRSKMTLRTLERLQQIQRMTTSTLRCELRWMILTTFQEMSPLPRLRAPTAIEFSAERHSGPPSRVLWKRTCSTSSTRTSPERSVTTHTTPAPPQSLYPQGQQAAQRFCKRQTRRCAAARRMRRA
eukprot:6206279-Pleurochrysis_carterae.AAC.4